MTFVDIFLYILIFIVWLRFQPFVKLPVFSTMFWGQAAVPSKWGNALGEHSLARDY